jgi:hypothetical protein
MAAVFFGDPERLSRGEEDICFTFVYPHLRARIKGRPWLTISSLISNFLSLQALLAQVMVGGGEVEAVVGCSSLAERAAIQWQGIAARGICGRGR